MRSSAAVDLVFFFFYCCSMCLVKLDSKPATLQILRFHNADCIIDSYNTKQNKRNETLISIKLLKYYAIIAFVHIFPI